MVRRSVPGANEVPALKAHSHDFVTLHRSARWSSSSWSSAIATSALWGEAEVRSYGHVPLSPLATTYSRRDTSPLGLPSRSECMQKSPCVVVSSCIGTSTLAPASHPAVPLNLVQVRGWVALLEHAATDLKTELSDDDAQIYQELSDWLFVSAVRTLSALCRSPGEASHVL